MSRYRLESAEEGTPDVDAFIDAGFEPFAVVNVPVTEPETERIAGLTVPTGREVIVGRVNVIWFRRADG